MKMPFFLATLTAILMAAACGAASVGDKRPVGPAPRRIVVTQVMEASGEVVYLETTVVHAPVATTYYKQVTDNKVVRKVPYTVTETVTKTMTSSVTLPLKDGKISSLDGKQLEQNQLWGRVTVGTPILISEDGHPIDPVHLKGAALDTLLLIPAVPVPAAVKPNAQKGEPDNG